MTINEPIALPLREPTWNDLCTAVDECNARYGRTILHLVGDGDNAVFYESGKISYQGRSYPVITSNVRIILSKVTDNRNLSSNDAEEMMTRMLALYLDEP